ncbi:ABC transporter substrate-binding protein [Streptacidiphilus fuscans]|uniref:ABC transporter substrate-binding protein n=1 Tax=Streptacidiphilus fuscans TaxID=2789292 RepID=A0A931FE57_9ACTN|nr:ABC transporter substrate-binding protein [Streptacidiphilus fuscans]MBF9067204.1 ABC transporter substrate-binding protein [Streptacidiphilus fuscans]
MRRSTTITSIAVLTALGMSLTACSGSSSPKGGGSGGSGNVAAETLYLEDNTGATAFTEDFNPFDGNSFSRTQNTDSLIYEPLLQYNTLNPSQAPTPWLANSITWSTDGRTATIHLRPGVKWTNGTALTSADVAFTYQLVTANAAANTQGVPKAASITTPDANTVVLSFASPQMASAQAIGNQLIVPKAQWSTVSNPATAVIPAAQAVGTGPYLVDAFTAQKVSYKANSGYWDGKPKVPEVAVANYASNDAATTALAQGQLDLAGNDINNVLTSFVAKNPQTNHLFQSTAPYFPAGNTVALLMNTKSATAPALADVAVRKAISAGLDRASMASQCETNYELPASSSGGLTLPLDQSSLDPATANDLKPASDPSSVQSLLTADGWSKTGGKWTKAGKTISFTIIDPNSFTDYWCDAKAIQQTLNGLGFDVQINGDMDYNGWNTAITTGKYDVALHWGQGTTAFQRLQFMLDSTMSAPIGQPSAGDFSHYQSSAADQAVRAYEDATTPAAQQSALNTLQQQLSTDVPAVPVLYGASWYEFSTANFTGWPTQANAYVNPTPTDQTYEYMILHLTPVK